MPALTVIIPTYNRAHLLPRAIKSVLNQTFQDFEIIIVEDCANNYPHPSTFTGNDKRIRYFRLKKRSGAPIARNFAILRSTAEYIVFLDDDDEMLPLTLEKLYNSIIKDTHIGCCYGDWIDVYDNHNKKRICMPLDKIVEKDFYFEWKFFVDGEKYAGKLAVLIPIPSFWIYPKKVLLKIGGYPNVPIRHDSFMQWFIVKQGYKFVHLCEVLYIRYVQKESITSKQINLAKENKPPFPEFITFRKMLSNENFSRREKAMLISWLSILYELTFYKLPSFLTMLFASFIPPFRKNFARRVKFLLERFLLKV